MNSHLPTMSERAAIEIGRVLKQIKARRRYSARKLAELIGVKETYLRSVLYQGRNPNEDFLQKCDAIRKWPEGATPSLPWLSRVINTHYIRTGRHATETEMHLHEQSEQMQIRILELEELAEVQRRRIQIMQRELDSYREAEEENEPNRERLSSY